MFRGSAMMSLGRTHPSAAPNHTAPDPCGTGNSILPYWLSQQQVHDAFTITYM